MNRRLPALVGLASLASVAHGLPPTVVTWQDAGRHVGEVVTVEGVVAGVECASDACILAFAPDDPLAFRAVLLLTLLSDAPSDPERSYRDRRVRVSGRIARFKGRPEMVLRSARQIEVLEGNGSGAPEEPPDRPRATPPPMPPPSTPPPPVRTEPARPQPPAPRTEAAPPAPPPTLPSAPSPRPPAPSPAARQPAADGCEAAKASWRTAATEARQHLAALDRCLAAAEYRCDRERAALTPLLANLDQAEQRVAERCR